MDRKILEKLSEGRGVKSICKSLNVGKDRVKEVRAKGINYLYLSLDGRSLGSVEIPPIPQNVFPEVVDLRLSKTSEIDTALLEKKDWIVERLTASWSPITIFEELDLVAGSKSSFYRFLHRHDLYQIHRNQPSLIAPIVHESGEALILDWGKLRDVVDQTTGEVKTLWAFVGVMGFSRYMMVRLVWTNSVEVTMDAIESMLREIGGVPRRVTSDNPKCFAIKADKYDPILNPSFERLAHHYQFRIECLPPADPKKKGKVERLVPYARRIFEAYPQDWTSIETAQKYMDKKCVIANERRHGTTCLKPIEIFLTEEAGTLRELPSLAYEKEEMTYATVRRDGFARFSNKYYAVADQFIEKEVVILGSKSRISIFANGNLIETYDRIKDQHQSHIIADHLKKPWQKVEENNKHYLDKAKRMGASVEAVIRVLVLRSEGFIDTRIIWGILSLDKKYSNDLIDQACAEAYRISRFSSKYVEKVILDLMKSKHLLETKEKHVHQKTKFTSTNQYGQYVSEIFQEVKVELHEETKIIH